VAFLFPVFAHLPASAMYSSHWSGLGVYAVNGHQFFEWLPFSPFPLVGKSCQDNNLFGIRFLQVKRHVFSGV